MRPIASCLILFLFVPFVSAKGLPGQDGQTEVVSSARAEGPNSPSPVQDANPEALPNSPSSVRAQAAENNPQFVAQQSSPPQQQSPASQQAQEPVGTAAAGSVETTGVAASKPAGAAIAPAKQRRTRALLIKVSALVGASVAIGTVVALSNASPSRPPGAR
jgi:hypothetical protein